MRKIVTSLLAATLLCGTAAAMDTEISVMRILMPNNPMAEQKINNVMEKIEADAFARSAEIRAVEEEDRANGDIRSGYYCGVRTELTYRSANYTSIAVNFEYNSAGAHGYAGITGYVFDNHTGAQLALTDLPGYEWNEYVAGLIREDVEGRRRGHEPHLLEKALAAADYNFYLDANGVPVVVFNPYEIGPYAMGQVKLILPDPVE